MEDLIDFDGFLKRELRGLSLYERKAISNILGKIRLSKNPPQEEINRWIKYLTPKDGIYSGGKKTLSKEKNSVFNFPELNGDGAAARAAIDGKKKEDWDFLRLLKEEFSYNEETGRMQNVRGKYGYSLYVKLRNGLLDEVAPLWAFDDFYLVSLGRLQADKSRRWNRFGRYFPFSATEEINLISSLDIMEISLT